MVYRNICEGIYSKIVVGESHYSVGKKYCRRCECYFITKKIFCQCCGIQLRSSPAERECKEKVNRGLYRSLLGCMTKYHKFHNIVGLAAKVKPILDETYGRRLIIADIGLLGSLYLLQK